MESYKVMLFLHVVAALVGFGSTFAFPFIQAAGERGGVGATRVALGIIDRTTKFLVIPAAILVPVFGVGLIFDDTTGYSDDFPGWLMGAITWYAILFLAGALVQNRSVDRAIQVLQGVPDGAQLPADYVALSKRMQMVGGLLSLSVIGITFLMVWKPGA